MIVEPLTGDLLEQVNKLEAKAYTNLVVSDFKKAEELYHEYYDLLKSREEELPQEKKYHKGTPLHNWGISLIAQNKMAEGFRKIILAYIEDLLNFANPEEAYGAPAYKTLQSYPLIDKEFLSRLFEISKKRRNEDRVPRNPEEILTEAQTTEGRIDLSGSLSMKNTDKIPVMRQLTPDIKTARIPDVAQTLETIGPKEKRVFIGGNYVNIALLQGIKDIVARKDFKPILVADFESTLNDHDKSIELLKGCSRAVFEISVSNGHLMEIERATDFEKDDGLKFILLYQGFGPKSDPKTTQMLLKFKDRMKRYVDLSELETRIHDFLSEE